MLDWGSGAADYSYGDSIRISIEDLLLNYYKNDVLLHSESLEVSDYYCAVSIYNAFTDVNVDEISTRKREFFPHVRSSGTFVCWE